VAEDGRWQPKAPWGSKVGMRVFAAISIILGACLFVIGIVLLFSDHSRKSFGIVLIVIGALSAAPVALSLPSARRRGKV